MYQKKVLSELKTKHIQIFSSISVKKQQQQRNLLSAKLK